MSLRFPLAAVLLLCVTQTAPAASTLVYMSFNNGGANINENTGWNGTTAAASITPPQQAGSINSLLTLSQAMMLQGNTGGSGMTAQNANDSFHVDKWHLSNANLADPANLSYVGFAFNSGANIVNLGDGNAYFATRLHHHASDTNLFDTVNLRISDGVNSPFYSASQAYNPAGGPQTLTWALPVQTSLQNLTGATHFDLIFTSSTNTDASNNNAGPEWALTDGAYIEVFGTVPEPSRAMLALLGIAGLGLRRRRATR